MVNVRKLAGYSALGIVGGLILGGILRDVRLTYFGNRNSLVDVLEVAPGQDEGRFSVGNTGWGVETFDYSGWGQAPEVVEDLGIAAYVGESNLEGGVEAVSSEPEEEVTRLILRRDLYTTRSTTGVLYLDSNNNGVVDAGNGIEKGIDERLCYTLEPVESNNERDFSCIPQGNYKLTPRTSPRRWQHFLVNGVENRDHILVHAGNHPGNTSGCILVGTSRGSDVVNNSRVALKSLRNRFENVENLELKITSAAQY